jgi:hypothetical protein
MSNPPEWVDDDPEPERPPDERQLLIDAVVVANNTLRATIDMLRNTLLRLDEIGAPVSRSRSRANKLDEVRVDWWAHFEYDVIKGQTRGTKDQQVRAERYELS